MSNGFTSKRLSRENRCFHYLALAWLALCVNVFGVWGMKAAYASFWGEAQAQELSFAPTLSQRDILLQWQQPVDPDPNVALVNAGTFALGKPGGYWLLPGGSRHQNAVLRAYQDALRSRGVTDADQLHYGAAILVSENERMVSTRPGDGGHSYGICQLNLAARFVSDFLKQHPEEATVQIQVNHCADRYAQALKTYHHNIFRAVVEHNCPACARAGVDSTRANHKPLVPSYFQRVTIATRKLSLL